MVEERHGFNKQTPGFYAKDQVTIIILNKSEVTFASFLKLFLLRVAMDTDFSAYPAGQSFILLKNPFFLFKTVYLAFLCT